jgi:nucleotide-binding universal stress UspA family protein
MKEIKRIIWATDGSKDSEEALNYARFFAQRFNSEIIGIHVIPTHERLLYDYSRDPDNELYRWVEKAAENYKAKLSLIVDELATHGLRFRGEVLIGEPYKEIIRFSRGVKADLVVMGTRGQGLIDRMLIGSTTLKVLRESSVPVLAVKKRYKEGTVEIRNILVPLDVNEKVDSALNCAIDLAEIMNVQISVLYVLYISEYKLYNSYNETLNKLVEDLIKRYSDELAKMVKETKAKRQVRNKESPNWEINTEIIQGINPSMRIIEYANSKNTDLIVINTHERNGMKRFILGSVTEKVIQEFPWAVLALRP